MTNAAHNLYYCDSFIFRAFFRLTVKNASKIKPLDVH